MRSKMHSAFSLNPFDSEREFVVREREECTSIELPRRPMPGIHLIAILLTFFALLSLAIHWIFTVAFLATTGVLYLHDAQFSTPHLSARKIRIDEQVISIDERNFRREYIGEWGANFESGFKGKTGVRFAHRFLRNSYTLYFDYGLDLVELAGGLSEEQAWQLFSSINAAMEEHEMVTS